MVGEILLYTKRPYAVDVFRNNEIKHSQIKAKKYDRIIISPGPGNPGDAHYFGVCKEVLLGVAHTVPTLGVCLGMQGIARFYGGKVVQAKHPMHGKTSLITHDGKGIFTGLPQDIEIMRYHSLVVTELPKDLLVTALVSGETDGEIMGLRHFKYPIEGIQFHPESFATEGGNEILKTFLLDPYIPKGRRR